MYIPSLYYMKEEWRKVAVCMYYHFIITRKNEEKLRFVYIISSLQHGRMRKSFAVYILSLFCSREGSGRDLVCIYQPTLHYNMEGWVKLWYVHIITLLPLEVFCPECEIPRRHRNTSRVWKERYLSLKYTVRIPEKISICLISTKGGA